MLIKTEQKWSELALAGAQYILGIVFWFIRAFVTFTLLFLYKNNI